MLPEEDILSVGSDTVKNFNCSYLVDDSIRTSDYDLFLGSYLDPVFGQVKADIYAPIYFDTPVIDKTGTYEITSVQLLLIDSSYQYGKKVAQDIDLYEFKDAIDTNYYAKLTFNPTETFISALTLDTTLSESEADTLEYTFSGDFVTRIKDFIASSSYNDSLDPIVINKEFMKVFKGLHFAPRSSDAFIEKIMDIQIRVKANVCSSDGDCKEVNQYMYIANYIDRDSMVYFHPLNSFTLEHPSALKGNEGKEYQDKVYLQSMKGYKARIRMNDLDKWRDTQKVVINSAKLVVPIETDDYAPVEIIEFAVDDEATYSAIESQELQGASQYSIYITSFVKNFIKSDKSASDYKFELRVPDNNMKVNRSIIKANDIYLQITYTKYK